ncbi:MAG: hypothetical protein KAG53_01955 [Endozoicomonadaceae bacterium]|nr:hypothetical protein [Endozoicomonadaceae bacterium]
MIKFSPKGLCSYTWNKNCFTHTDTITNIFQCIKTLVCSVFGKRQVKLVDVQRLYNLNHENTIFGAEYKNYLMKCNIEIVGRNNNSTLETKHISANDLKELIDANEFLNDVHYIVNEDFRYINDNKNDFLLPDNLTIVGNLILSYTQNVMNAQKNINVTGSITIIEPLD